RRRGADPRRVAARVRRAPRRAQLDLVARRPAPPPRGAPPPRLGVNRRDVEVGPGRLIAYGHWGRPLLVFPSEQGHRWDYESNGMIGAIESQIEGGRVKVYGVASYDASSWADRGLPLEDRARRHGRYEDWIGTA